MMTSLSLVLALTLLIPLPSPATPKLTRPLTSSEMDDIFLDIQDAIEVLHDSALTGNAYDVRNSPPGLLPRLLESGRFQPLPPASHPQQGKLSSELPVVFPASNEVEEEERALVKRDPAFAKPDVSYAVSMDGREKRRKSRFCQYLGPLACSRPNTLREVPQTRSASSLRVAQRKSSPSLYLFGGAIGR